MIYKLLGEKIDKKVEDDETLKLNKKSRFLDKDELD